MTQRSMDANIPDRATALWAVAPHVLELRQQALGQLAEGSLRVATLFSGVSAGTERLVLAGKVPESEWQRMRAPFQDGDFPFPVKYGYAAVGRVIEGDPSRIGQTVFALHPHQSLFDLPADALVPVPEDIPATRAILVANVETALNGIWDANASPGDHIAVVGGGVVGLLVARLCARIPATRVSVIDIDPARAPLARAFGAHFCLPGDAPGEQDLVIHASGHPDGLATALALAGMEATVLEMSWYGDRPVAAPLGGAFHSRRLVLKSSQVGQVPPQRRVRWSYRRRMEAALSLLRDPVLDMMLCEPISLQDAPARLPDLLSGVSGMLAQPIVHPYAEDGGGAPA